MITPTQHAEIHKIIMSEYEKIVDRILEKQPGPRITFVVPSDWNQRIVQAVIDHYKNHGWCVTENHGDQREPGHWLTFSYGVQSSNPFGGGITYR